MKTAEVYFTERNGGKHPERSLKDRELISPIWACLLMKEYAYECFKEKELEIADLLKFIDFLRDSCYGDGRCGWLLRTTESDMEFDSSEELYQWWSKNVKK